MSTAERYSIYPCSFVHAGGTMDLQQMHGFSMNPAARYGEVILGGDVDRARVSVASAQPTFQFQTRDFSTYFTDVSISAGLALTGNATFRYQERGDGATFLTGATHITFVADKGFIRPTQITASQDDQDGASITSELVVLADAGLTSPIAHTDAVDFSAAPAPSFGSRYYLGPVYHNAGQLSGITQVTVDPGINYVARIFDGDVWPTLGAIQTRQPTYTFTTAKADVGNALAIFGRAVSTSLAIYLRQDTASGTRTADASSAHVKVNCTAGLWAHNDTSVQENEDGTVSFTVMPTGTITVSTTSAIP